jgi:hypothetical protein
MGWLKREFIAQAFAENGIPFDDAQPDQQEAALRQLDTMIATWNAEGIRLGYPLPSSASGSSLDQDSGVPDRANEAIYLNLALRTARLFGKSPSQDLRTDARRAYGVVLAKSVTPRERKTPSGTPAGAGNERCSGSPFLPTEDEESLDVLTDDED